MPEFWIRQFLGITSGCLSCRKPIDGNLVSQRKRLAQGCRVGIEPTTCEANSQPTRPPAAYHNNGWYNPKFKVKTVKQSQGLKVNAAYFIKMLDDKLKLHMEIKKCYNSGEVYARVVDLK